MKSLVYTWLLVILVVAGGIAWFNRELNGMAEHMLAEMSAVDCLAGCLTATTAPDTVDVTEPFDIQPALGYKYVQSAGLNEK